MIHLRIHEPFSFGDEEPATVLFDGEGEEGLCNILCATLYRLGYVVERSEDQGPFVTVGEEE